MELGRGVHTWTATNRSNGLLQLPSFSYVLMFTNAPSPFPFLEQMAYAPVIEYNSTFLLIPRTNEIRSYNQVYLSFQVPSSFPTASCSSCAACPSCSSSCAWASSVERDQLQCGRFARFSRVSICTSDREGFTHSGPYSETLCSLTKIIFQGHISN